MKGIDGASVAGIPDCDELARLGYEFGFPRIAFGAHRDPSGPEYLIRLRLAGMLARPYVYLRSWEDARAQARFHVALARDLGCSFVWVDIEPAKAQAEDGSWPIPTDAPEQTREVVLAYLQEAIRLEMPVGIYGGAYYLRSLRLPEWVGGLPLWLADYNPPPNVPAPWHDHTVWQTKGNLRVGVASIDENETPLTREQLDALLGPGAIPAPLPYDILSPVIAATRAAAGHGAGSVLDFVTTDEGPIVGGDAPRNRSGG